MTDKNIGRLVADDQGKVCRILPDRDRAEGDREDKEPLATMVEEVMTRDPGADLRESKYSGFGVANAQPACATSTHR